MFHPNPGAFPPLVFPAQEELLPAAGALMTVAPVAPAVERSFWEAVGRQLEATWPEAGGKSGKSEDFVWQPTENQ